MSGQKIISTATIVYAILGLFVGFVVAWVVGFVFIGMFRALNIATGWILGLWLGFIVLFGLWAASLIPQMKTGLKAMPMSAFLWAMTLSIFIVFLVSLFQGLSAFGF